VADAIDVRLLQMQLWGDDDPIPSTHMVCAYMRSEPVCMQSEVLHSGSN
jgi:hypothetical protein